MKYRNSLIELFLWNFREFVREPEVVFWVFGFPVLLAIGLGVAFRNRPPEKVFVAVTESPQAKAIVEQLKETPSLQVQVLS